MSAEHRKDLNLDGLEELTGAKLVELEESYRLDWENGDFVQFHRDADRLHFDYLFSEATPEEDQHRLAQLVSTLPAFFRARGVSTFVTTRSGATMAMLKVGFYEDPIGQLLCPIAEGDCKMDEYTAWRAGSAPKPSWRG